MKTIKQPNALLHSAALLREKLQIGDTNHKDGVFLRDAVKVFGLTAYGFLIALIIYPVIHEGGHIIAAAVCGGEIKEIALFPLPSVLCDVSRVSNIGMVLIGLAGIFIPFAFSTVIRFKSFVGWYGSFIFKSIVFLSMLISCADIVMNRFGIANEYDDIIKVLIYWKGGELWLFQLLLSAAIVTLIRLVREHPIRRLCQTFGI